MAPVSAQFGDGDRLCVFMSPVQATWDEGAFALPLIQTLVPQGFTVIVYDSLSIADPQSVDLRQLVALWGEYLASQYLAHSGPVELLVGDALGGAVVQGLLGLPFGNTARRVLLLSGPTLADQALAEKLGMLSRLALSGMLVTSLSLLDQVVQPVNPAGLYPIVLPTQPADPQAARIRLGYGYVLLDGVDFRSEVLSYGGPLLAIYGLASQLVRAPNVFVAPFGRQRRIGVPDGGMRPLTDDLPLVKRALQELVSN